MGRKAEKKTNPRTTAASRIFGSAGDEQAARRIKRHLDDLERANYTESSGGGGGGFQGGVYRNAETTKEDELDSKFMGNGMADEDVLGRKKKKQSSNVRALLTYRKNLSALLEEANLSTIPKGTPTYMTAAAAAPVTPPVAVCTVCGSAGRYKCNRCRLMYCSGRCQSTHDEARCERRIL